MNLQFIMNGNNYFSLWIFLIHFLQFSWLSYCYDDFLIQNLGHFKSKCNFNPKWILDGGANQGSWTRDVHSLFKDTKFFMIEGNYECSKMLSNPELSSFATFEISLIGKEVHNVSYYTYKTIQCNTGSSIFKEYSWDEKYFQTRLVNTIDNIVKSKNVGPFQMIKLDIQGSEVAALKGATETVKHAEILLTEAPMMHYNKGAPTFLKLYEYIDYLGFDLYDISAIHRQKFTVDFDALWVRKTSSLWDEHCSGYPRRNYTDIDGKFYVRKSNLNH